MKFQEMKDLTVDELRKRYENIREELFETKMKHSFGQVSNPLVVRFLRRDLARIKTALSSKLIR